MTHSRLENDGHHPSSWTSVRLYNLTSDPKRKENGPHLSALLTTAPNSPDGTSSDIQDLHCDRMRVLQKEKMKWESLDAKRRSFEITIWSALTINEKWSLLLQQITK